MKNEKMVTAYCAKCGCYLFVQVPESKKVFCSQTCKDFYLKKESENKIKE